MLHILSIPTWIPNTPMAQAVDTWLDPNQTAAKRGGVLWRNTWDVATNVCPMKVTQNLSGATDTALIHEPKAVPRAPKIIAHLKPYKNQRNVTDRENSKYKGKNLQKKPHEMARYRTQDSPVRDRRLITSLMAWPVHSLRGTSLLGW